MVDQKINYNNKARSSAQKGLGVESARFTKDRYLFQKDHSQYIESQSTKSFPVP